MTLIPPLAPCILDKCTTASIFVLEFEWLPIDDYQWALYRPNWRVISNQPRPGSRLTSDSLDKARYICPCTARLQEMTKDDLTNTVELHKISSA